jgi:hypothetical protein
MVPPGYAGTPNCTGQYTAVELLSVVRLDTAKVAVCVCRLLHISRIAWTLTAQGFTGLT